MVVELSTLGKFGVILADPPWAYQDLGHSRRIDRQYSTLSLDEVCALPVAMSRPMTQSCSCG